MGPGGRRGGNGGSPCSARKRLTPVCNAARESWESFDGGLMTIKVPGAYRRAGAGWDAAEARLSHRSQRARVRSVPSLTQHYVSVGYDGDSSTAGLVHESILRPALLGCNACGEQGSGLAQTAEGGVSFVVGRLGGWCGRRVWNPEPAAYKASRRRAFSHRSPLAPLPSMPATSGKGLVHLRLQPPMLPRL